MDRHGFTQKNVCFSPSEFFRLVLKLKKGSYIQLDEPAVILSNRRWWEQVNQCVVWCIESFRSKELNLILTCINSNLIDVAVRSFLINFMIVVKEQGEGTVYTVEPSQFKSIVRTPFLCDLYFPLPERELYLAYERKKAIAQDKWYRTYQTTADKLEKVGESFDQMFHRALEIKDKLRDSKGEYHVAYVMREMGCGYKMAQSVVKLLKDAEEK